MYFLSIKKIAITTSLLLILVGGFCQGAYVKKYKKLADSLSRSYHIPSSVILGVAVIESSTGKSRTCRLLNNHFGIVGKNDLWKTKKIKTKYKQFKNATASYVAFCNLIKRRKFYPKLKKEKKYLPWIDAISKSGYSVVPEIWKKKVLDAIKDNHLK